MDFSIKLVFLLILFEPTLQQSCDVFFIIDGSNVITDNARSGDRLQHWYSIRTIVADVLQNLTNFNVAISIYADKVWQVATYPTFGPQASLIMKSLDFLGGQFAVGAAIKWTRENVITPNKQTNANVACFLLATYPPFSNDLIVWNTEKNLLRNICGKLIVLAIGRIDLENVYKSIATSSDSFLRIDFTNLSENKAIGSFMLNQILSACPSRPTSATFSTITTTTLRPAQAVGCFNQMDVIFIFDASAYSDSRVFESMKMFVANQILDMDIESGKVHMGILSFAESIVKFQKFSNITTRLDARNFVFSLMFVGGSSKLAEALTFVRQMFLTDNGRRSNVPLMIFLLTTGNVEEPGRTVFESVQLKNAGAMIVVISTSANSNLNVINSIASYPYEKNVYNLFNLTNLLSTICDNSFECQNPLCQRNGQCVQSINTYFCFCQSGYAGKNCESNYCRNSTNLFFALTATSSISSLGMARQLELVRNVVTNVNLRDSRVGIGVYFNNSLDVHISLSTFDIIKNDIQTFQQRLYDSVSAFPRNGYTNLSNVLNTVRTTLFSDGSNNILILFVSGVSSNIYASTLEARLARTGSKSIQILVIPIGQQYSLNEINGIASSSSGSSVVEDGSASFKPSPNIFFIDDTLPLDYNVTTRLTKSFCNSENECLSNPCQNQGTCVDLINGYRCTCSDVNTGSNCERSDSGQLDIVIGMDASGSIRYERFYRYVLSFIVTLVSRWEISSSKTRVAAVKWNRYVTDLFHLDTYSSTQDVVWALQQVTYEFNAEGTNTAAALEYIRDVILNPGQNGERPSARNIVLLFTDGNSNVNELATIPTAIDLRIKREAYIITFGVGSDVNPYELYALSSFPVRQDESYFIVENGNMVFSKLNPYLQSVFTSETNCQNSQCQNGGVCMASRKEAICRCYGNFGGAYCDKTCLKGNDVAILLDTSGSGNYQQVFNVNIKLARAIAVSLPFDTNKFSLIQFGNSAKLMFQFNNFTRPQDLYEAFSFRISTGVQALGSALSYLHGQPSNFLPKVFVPESGDRPNAANIAVIITNSDSISYYQDLLREADRVKSDSVSIHAILVGDYPDQNLFSSIVSNQNYLLRIKSENEINDAIEKFRENICN